MVMLGCAWRRADTATVPMMPISKLTAKQMSVPTNVTRRTRTGIAYQRGGCGVGGMLVGYTIPGEGRFSDLACPDPRLSDPWISDQKKYRSIQLKYLEST